MTHSLLWAPGRNGAGKRPYFVSRHPSDRGGEALCSADGKIRRFASMEAAQRAADQANETEVQEPAA